MRAGDKPVKLLSPKHDMKLVSIKDRFSITREVKADHGSIQPQVASNRSPGVSNREVNKARFKVEANSIEMSTKGSSKEQVSDLFSNEAIIFSRRSGIPKSRGFNLEGSGNEENVAPVFNNFELITLHRLIIAEENGGSTIYSVRNAASILDLNLSEDSAREPHSSKAGWISIVLINMTGSVINKNERGELLVSHRDKASTYSGAVRVLERFTQQFSRHGDRMRNRVNKRESRLKFAKYMSDNKAI